MTWTPSDKTDAIQSAVALALPFANDGLLQFERGGSLMEEYGKKIAESKMPEEVLKEAKRELDRLERTSEQQAEHGWIRTYIDRLCEIPWSERTEGRLEIHHAVFGASVDGGVSFLIP